MSKENVSKQEMKDLKGGFNPVFSMDDSDTSVRIPPNSATQCVKTYLYRVCVSPLLFQACD